MAEMWQLDISHVVKEEERMWDMDNLTDTMINHIIINVGMIQLMVLQNCLSAMTPIEVS